MNSERTITPSERVTPADYCAIFAGRRAAPVALAGVCGRLIRVGAGQSPEYLSYPPERRLAWVVGPDGLAGMVGKTGLQILLDLGTKPCRIWDNLRQGMRWVMAVFPEASCTWATWDGLFDAIGRHHPAGVVERLHRWAGALPNGTGLLTEEQKARYGNPAVREHPDHPDHMTPERYLAGADTPANAWLFLWHSVGVNDLYTGAGYCRSVGGHDGIREYLAPNARVAELGASVSLIELDVQADAARAGW